MVRMTEWSCYCLVKEKTGSKEKKGKRNTLLLYIMEMSIGVNWAEHRTKSFVIHINRDQVSQWKLSIF